MGVEVQGLPDTSLYTETVYHLYRHANETWQGMVDMAATTKLRKYDDEGRDVSGSREKARNGIKGRRTEGRKRRRRHHRGRWQGQMMVSYRDGIIALSQPFS
jgi:hypothetical protein